MVFHTMGKNKSYSKKEGKKIQKLFKLLRKRTSIKIKSIREE